jgi:hypothetical protein
METSSAEYPGLRGRPGIDLKFAAACEPFLRLPIPQSTLAASRLDARYIRSFSDILQPAERMGLMESNARVEHLT